MITKKEMRAIRKLIREWYDLVAMPRIVVKMPLQTRDFVALQELMTTENINRMVVKIDNKNN